MNTKETIATAGFIVAGDLNFSVREINAVNKWLKSAFKQLDDLRTKKEVGKISDEEQQAIRQKINEQAKQVMFYCDRRKNDKELINELDMNQLAAYEQLFKDLESNTENADLSRDVSDLRDVIKGIKKVLTKPIEQYKQQTREDLYLKLLASRQNPKKEKWINLFFERAKDGASRVLERIVDISKRKAKRSPE
ncbi:hypothetical protein SAMN05444392_103216 [Seinonella peptonophila]|uniref:Uncharacterized protein n=1 Tax=Seinonella peptonophila TaxID=112248 RepID=A0A1M4WGW8_9BACL|nr:hypothetical protein [Seinonella peptonophila]SHE80476.1 hypothetical protein SAMN05444392_103216 [Seinonella peptonophila]